MQHEVLQNIKPSASTCHYFTSSINNPHDVKHLTSVSSADLFLWTALPCRMMQSQCLQKRVLDPIRDCMFTLTSRSVEHCGESSVGGTINHQHRTKHTLTSGIGVPGGSEVLRHGRWRSGDLVCGWHCDSQQVCNGCYHAVDVVSRVGR